MNMPIKAHVWYDRDIETHRLDDTGINVRAAGLNFTAHFGPNKMDRHIGYEAGISLNGSRVMGYWLITIWVIYRTLNIGVTWKPRAQ